MDGNGRWAQEKGFPRAIGHKKGADAVEQAVDACIELGVDYVTLYAFSIENWQRPELEIKSLMGLLELFLQKKLKTLQKKNVRLKTIGRTHQLPTQIQTQLLNAIESTKNNTGVTMTLALSYGGREEIVDAVKQIAQKVTAKELKAEDITQQVMQDHLYAPNTPDPDLLIRTSGEIRLSNFLLWQLSYTEFVLTEKYWPDFTKNDLFEAVKTFQNRHRRFGIVTA